MATTAARWKLKGKIPVRDVELYVEVIGHGPPLLLMHGGPSGDHWTLESFRRLADQFTVVLYDHRCNGRSTGVPVSSMTWENLTADADALRERLGFERWTVLGHSFGGHVALEYALRYPERLSHLVLLDTGGDATWAQQHAAEVVEARDHDPEKAELVRRWFNGSFKPREYVPIFFRISDAYVYGSGWSLLLRSMSHGGWRSRIRPAALRFAGQELLPGWSVMDRLGEITAPTLVMAGTYDFVFPPECQQQLAGGIPGARLHLVDKAGHNPQEEQTDEVMRELTRFLRPTAQAA